MAEITREKVLGILEEQRVSEIYWHNEERALAFAYAIAAIEREKHGRWIRQNETFTTFQCSACKDKNFALQFDYCPNCGARMDEEAEHGE